jgi:hypothetical protein
MSLERACALVRAQILPARLVGGSRWFCRTEDVTRYALTRATAEQTITMA